MTELRLDRYLANMGSGTRTEVKKIIKSGKVLVNDQTVKDPGFQLLPEKDRVSVAGEIVVYHRYIYLMLNKPAGYVSATEDFREKTVLDLIDSKYHHKGIFPIGRLDKDTEGLLVLSNNGELGHRLLSPKKHVFKHYQAKIDGLVTDSDRQAFEEGIVLDDNYRTLPAKLEILSAGPISEVIVKIREGKFHQIKRMFQALGKKVVYLKRIAMGDLKLDNNLKPGEYRELTKNEICLLSGTVED